MRPPLFLQASPLTAWIRDGLGTHARGAIGREGGGTKGTRIVTHVPGVTTRQPGRRRRMMEVAGSDDEVEGDTGAEEFRRRVPDRQIGRRTGAVARGVVLRP